MKAPKPYKRAGFWYLIRNVPVAYRALDPRGQVQTSTGIRVADDPNAIRARPAVRKLNEELEVFWRDLAAGGAQDARARYDAAKVKARALGLTYRSANEVAATDFNDIIARVKTLLVGKRIEDEKVVEAVMGGVDRPDLMLSDLPTEYERIMRASLVDMSPDQLRIWRNTPKRVVTSLTERFGDRPLVGPNALTRDEALDLREAWQTRIVAGEASANTANREVSTINKIMRTVSDAHRLGLEPIFAKLHISEPQKGQRTAFPVQVVQGTILKDGQFDALNPEARRVIFLITETGLRPSEAVNLTRKTIKLDAEVPHIQVRPEGRRLKTAQSWRDVPLVGVAYQAMLAQPDGFPRYRDKASALSTLLNKAFRARNIGMAGEDEDDASTLYSLRHTFEDRLTAVEAPEKVVAVLMGHKWHRPKYGAGPSLHQLAVWLNKIALRPPASV